ncbi:probable cellulose synthase A catalytic subunit 8 [UDP-forming] isoform X1 [Vitis riparia]|uniref:probable cellulose synthase A catalytic subunit 8 [UDP-forming] isoform X1 n=2 Tax=Vitis riparia TaxID=96939 RepID=UPI00155AB893|nr:probable cellulose synthase A catalytic subunit 8 [UDP-forming] isoform X1 [Vitis riparia]XP_034691446.1 probable cellulose synthase A catalytic subunit 8 [UDP-forming] isoform X1 [Vitis riparia]
MSFNSNIWEERLCQWKLARERLLRRTGSQEEIPDPSDLGSVDEMELRQPEMDNESRQFLSRKVPIPPSMIYPYRVSVIFRLVILVFFLRYRLTHPVHNAYGLWLASVFCEVWFSVSWILDQLPKWQPVNRQTFPERLCMRYNQPGKPSGLASVDVFVSIADPLKESPIVISNTILSILSVDYPAEKVSCYVSDEGASRLTLETLSLTCDFARKWVPFCKKFQIEPPSPESYFSQKVDHLKYNPYPTFSKERRLMKRQYEDFKAQINGLITKFQDVPSEGWTMKDGTPWPGNDIKNHLGMMQIIMGRGGPHGSDTRALPQVVYVSREKRPGFHHNNKAGAMNALVRVSALLTNGTYILNLDSDHYINNSRTFLEAMCFLMDPSNQKICFVQFPQRFEGVDANDRYGSHNTIFYDINLKGFDGIQGPFYLGTGCFLYRKALCGYDPSFEQKILNTRWLDLRMKRPSDNHGHYFSDASDESSSSLLVQELNSLEREFPSSFQSMEMCFGQAPLLIASNFVDDDIFSSYATIEEILRAAIHVISCDYEDKTAWGIEVGWIYGSQTGDVLTGLKMHARGWRSVYCMPVRAAFRGSAPINLSDRLTQVLFWATSSIEILFSRHCPIWYGYGGGLKLLERVAYINAVIYPIFSVPLLIYCALPAICHLSGKSIISPITYEANIWFMLVVLSIFAHGFLELRWSGVSLQERWRNQQFWVIAGVSSHFFAIFQGLFKVMLGLNTRSSTLMKTHDEDSAIEFYKFKWTSLLILPTTLILINLWAVVAMIFSIVVHGYGSFGPLFAKLFFSFCVIVHLYPFLKGLLVWKHNIPTVVILWSLILATLFCLLWVQLDPFTTRFQGPDAEACGYEC